ncbi:magnesium and cobalt transport protein CorA [Cryptosporangium phraense]|uniref:Magnesium and cobalt transport protein CorA n=1 Tax=Cryptosporangium phraense TaxID=2593070 RepID=A0A545AHU3_9ACTN|nr:magnesium and cobalt transport protein CorA [Cryptosporangium phraense]TQS40255.1 magnesium and cobalt transport protein CorA [Cryptosporangium phraense]
MRASAFRRLARFLEGAADEPTEPSEQPRPNHSAEHAVVDCARYVDGVRVKGRLPLAEAPRALRRRDGFVWVGLREPTAEQFAEVAERFALPPLAVADAVTAHQRPKLERYGEVLFAVLKPVHYVNADEVVDVAELAVFVGPKFVVIVRHGDTDVPARVRALADGDPEVSKHGPLGVLHRIMDVAVDGYTEAIDGIDENIDDIESQVFGGDENDHAERIYKLKREVLEFRRAVKPLAPALQRLSSPDSGMVGETLRPYFRDVHDHLMRAADAIDQYDSLLTDVLQADLAQVSVRQNRTAMRQNEDMRRISAWAAIALLPTAIAGLYGMNFDHIPGSSSPYGFWAVIGVLAAACVLLWVSFRRNGWL